MPEPQRATAHVPAGITLMDSSHFRMHLPALRDGAAPSVIDYVRLQHGSDPAPASDPFSGYYLGSFGSHGPELLLLQRGIWDGEDAVIAHKVTGAHYDCRCRKCAVLYVHQT